MTFKNLLVFTTTGLGGAIFGLLLWGEYRTWQVQHSPEQKSYLGGTIPEKAPKGFYAGEVPGLSGSPWQGKRFDPTNSSGINIFVTQNKASAKYPFRTSTGQSSRDGTLRVLRIEYNNPANPWWVRLFLDEVVEVSRGVFLGKLSLQIVPGRPYQITFFKLTEDNARFRVEPK